MKSWTVTPAGLIPYEMSNGTYVVVSASKPLPAAVTADITTRVTAARGTAADSVESGGKVTAIQQTAEENTGKTIVLVRQGYTYTIGPGATLGLYWIVSQDSRGAQIFTTEAEALATAKQDAGSDPTTAVIVAP